MQRMSETGLESANGRRPTGAVVIGGDYQGLGIVRSIGRLGAPVCVIDDERSISHHSRFASSSIRVPRFRSDDQVVETLLDVGDRLGLHGWVLFPTRDPIVNSISRNRDRLSSFYRVPTPPWETIRWASDKRRTYELAVEIGIPTPWTAWPESEDELASLDVTFPVAVKPATERFVRTTRAKAWRADSREQLTALFVQAQELVADGDVMIQELIPGDGNQQYSYCAFFKDGGAVASMQARRTRQHPWEFGRASTYVESVANDTIAEQSVRLLQRLDYYGLVELEYKQDPRTGAFKLLDINPRTWGYHTLGAAAGVDFARILFQDQIGQTVPTQTAQPGVKWLRLVTDVPTGIADISARRTTLGSYIKSARAADVEAVWDRGDPRPWFAELLLLPYLMITRGF
jgi:predicted ATP-grasp superfamily ATP-dependent carboligase